jgi:hypothetical protein
LEQTRNIDSLEKAMLLRHVEKFLRETGMPWTKFGRLAARDPRFVEDLRNGRTPRPRTEARIVGFMHSYREGLHAQ